MLQSTFVKENPNLYVFLPVLYMVWSDAVLTPTEIKSLQQLINDQLWLKNEEKQFLLSFLNPSLPPSAEQIKNWLEEIRKVELLPEKKEGLIDIGVKLARLHGNGKTDSLAKQPGLEQLENSLGGISREAVFNFVPSSRTTITNTQATRKRFSVSKMTSILDGKDHDIITKVKTILADPEFKRIDTGDLLEYYCTGVNFSRHKDSDRWLTQRQTVDRPICAATFQLWKR
jgi:acyl-CoA oxidase